MRVLLYCPRCRRQVDASEASAGSAFRCRCGEEIAVPRVRAADAVVVRCSSCGAPREEGAAACGYCGADFTARERDENTMCPVCLARIGDRARFCSACGAGVAPEEDASSGATDRVCPACDGETKLSSRPLGATGFSALACDRCGGLWLGDDVFRALLDRARAEQAAEPVREDTPERAKRSAPSGYHRCPVCRAMMNRRNFGRRSGILVDQCRDHGIWLDDDELARILRWIRSGGESLATERDRQDERAAASAARFRVEPKSPDEIPFAARDDDPGTLGGGLLGALTRILVTRMR